MVKLGRVSEGGLNMLNIHAFIATMKISWIKKMNTNDRIHAWIETLYPIISNLHVFGGEYANILMEKIKNPVWKDVMKHYKKLSSKCKVDNLSEFLAENIHYNINTRINILVGKV